MTGTALLFFAVAALYSSVGHAGASGYLMVMALATWPVAQMRPTALVLNIFVATLTVVRFHRAGYVRWKACVPLVLGSVPVAYLATLQPIPDRAYKLLLALCLMVSAGRLLMKQPEQEEKGIPPLGGFLVGAGIGLLAGLTGTGGGVFLTPLLILACWQGPRAAAGTSAFFIWMNSWAGIIAKPSALADLPPGMPIYVTAGVIGGLLGSWLGSQRLQASRLKQLLAVVLLSVAVKLVFG